MSIKESVIAEYNQTRDFSQKAIHSACYAPWVSLYFDTLGNVQACCQNTKFPLGNIARQSIDEIWRGKKVASLRKALAKDNLAAGCQFCEWQISVGNYLGTFTRNFEQLPVLQEEPEWPSMMEFSISNTCNLECIMCNGMFSSSIRARREGLPPLLKAYSDDFFLELRKYLPHLKFAKFLGGEPFLAQENHRIWDMMIEDGLKFPCHVTTNGTQWNSRVERVLEHIPCTFSISMDGFTKETVESIRVNAPFELVRENFLKFRAYARARKTYIGLTYCLMRQNWHEFGDYLLFADEHDCEVIVNTVREPPHCSLYRLPVDELEVIVKALERQGETLLAQLGRNRGVWETQVSALRLRLENEWESARAPFKSPLSLYIGDLSALESMPVEQRMNLDRAETILRQWGGTGQVIRFTTDADDRITDFQSPDEHFFGIPADECKGLRFAQVVDDMRARLGDNAVIELGSSGDYVDRLIDFNESGSVFATRLISIPILNEYGLHGGSSAVAMGRFLSAKSDDTLQKAMHSIREWADGNRIVILERDTKDVVTTATFENDEIHQAEWIGKKYLELAPIISRTFRLTAYHSESWTPALTTNHIDRFMVYRAPKYQVTFRETMVRRVDEEGQFLGWTTILSGLMFQAENQEEYLRRSESRLNEWAPDGQTIRVYCDLEDKIESVDSNHLASVQIDDLIGRPVSDLAPRLIEHLGRFGMVRSTNSSDSLISFTPPSGDINLRVATLPRYRNSHRLGTVQILRTDRIVPFSLRHSLTRQNWQEFGDYLLHADMNECDVAVNSMPEQRDSSLLELPVEELEKIVTALERQGDSLVPQLKRNREVWLTQISLLRLKAENEWEAIRGPSRLFITDLASLRRLPAEQRMNLDRAESTLREWIDTDHVVRFSADANDRIVDIQSPDNHLFGIPADRCKGLRFVQLLDELKSRYGESTVNDLGSSGEFVDRTIDFLGPEGLFAARFLSVPILNEFGLPCGSHAVAAGRLISSSTDDMFDTAMRSMHESADGDRIAVLERNTSDVVERASIESKELLRENWIGKKYGELTPSISRFFMLLGEPNESWNAERKANCIDRFSVYRAPAILVIHRDIAVRRFGNNGQFVGWTSLLSSSTFHADNQEEYTRRAETRLNEWSPDGHTVRIYCDIDDKIERVDSNRLADVPIDDMVGRHVNEVAQRLIDHLGMFQMARVKNGLDMSITFTLSEGDLEVRAAILPRYVNLDRAGSVHIIRVAQLVPSLSIKSDH